MTLYYIDNLRQQINFYDETGIAETASIMDGCFVYGTNKHDIDSLPYTLSVMYDREFIECMSMEDFNNEVQQLKANENETTI